MKVTEVGCKDIEFAWKYNCWSRGEKLKHTTELEMTIKNKNIYFLYTQTHILFLQNKPLTKSHFLLLKCFNEQRHMTTSSPMWPAPENSRILCWVWTSRMESIQFPGFESWSTGGTCRRNIWAEQVVTRLEVMAAGVCREPPEPRGQTGAAKASVDGSRWSPRGRDR